MLAIQSELENLFVSDWEIASLTPVHPDRIRVVLGDGRVFFRPGPMPSGPGLTAQGSRLNARFLRREGDDWRDPADYLHDYEPVEEWEAEESDSLPEGTLTFEGLYPKYFWRTDLGVLDTNLKPDQALQLHRTLCEIGKSFLVNMLRVRRYGQDKAAGGWLELDNGERIEFSSRRTAEVCQALGVQSLHRVDRSHSLAFFKLRDYPYDLDTAEPELVRRDCATAKDFLYGWLWRSVLRSLAGQTEFGWGNVDQLAGVVAAAASRCGYTLSKLELQRALSYLVHDEGIIELRQLGLVEEQPRRRVIGKTRPEVLLYAPHQKTKAALALANRLGISLLLSKPPDDRLPLEHMADELKAPLHIFLYGVGDRAHNTLLRVLDFLGLSWVGEPTWLEHLDDLPEKLKQLPEAYLPAAPVPFRRIPLQANQRQLLMADPEEIAAWSPTLFSRWRVVLTDGQVLHHPGPVPDGPWVELDGHRVQPRHLSAGKDPAGFVLGEQRLKQPRSRAAAPVQPGPALTCAPERVLWLEDQADGTHWCLDDGSRVAVGMPAEQAAAHHPGLIRLRRGLWLHHNRIRYTGQLCIEMDGGMKFPIQSCRSTHLFQRKLGLSRLDRLAADDFGLQGLGVRDFPFEIARAPASVLKQHFATPRQLIMNILYQTYDMYLKTGQFPYGRSFSGYYYRPLQAALYRLGFLSAGQQAEDAVAAGTVKDRLFVLFQRHLHELVRHNRLFTYRQFGFGDPWPEDRMLGEARPHQVLAVEKGDQVERFARQLQGEFGLTMILLKGSPTLIASEFFVEMLKAQGIFEVDIFFFGDFDYGGWDIGPALARQLEFYGVGCKRVERLVLPGCFTREELTLHSREFDIPNSKVASRVRRFVQESGGINGEPRGIHANHFSPYERVRARLEELLASQA